MLALEEAILALPLIGRVYERIFRPATYYTEDTRQMFEETVHRVVVAVVSGVLTVNSMSKLAPEQTTPKTKPSIRVSPA